MATERITYTDEQAEMSNALEDAEIARLMKLVSESGYKKSENAPTFNKQAFVPRSLVEIAMESQKKREQKESPTNIGSDLKENINQGVDINTQGEGTFGDNPNDDSPISNDAVSQTKEMELTDLAPPSQSDKDIIGTEDSQLPNTSNKHLDSAETTEEVDVLQASTLPQKNKDDENANSKITQNEANDFNQHDLTESELSKAVDNASVHYDEGFSAGLEAGRNEIKEALDQEFSEKQITFDSLITALTKMRSAETKELESDIQAAILSLASERAGIAILEMPENFITRIEQLMSRLGSSLDSPVVKLNIADLKHIEAAKENSETLSRIRFIEDETLKHGDISISLAGIEIEDILENKTFFSLMDDDLEADMEQPNSELSPDTLIDADLETVMEQPNSELNADRLASSETVDKNTLEDNISDNLIENTADSQESYKKPTQEIGDEKQNIGNENTNIDPADGVA